MKDLTEKVLSANEAKKVLKRARAPRQIARPMEYTVILEDGTEQTGSLNTVQKLCPKVPSSTLHRRLASGERKIAVLKRPANGRCGSQKNRRKPFTF